MGGVLTVRNDCSNNFELQQANIFTLGQGFCLQRREPKHSSNFKFDQNLAYGSWYDIQIIGRCHCSPSAATTATTIEVQRYLKKGIYLSYGKTITVSELTNDENRDHGATWQCGSCKQKNFGSLALCEHCYTNKAQMIISVLSYVPIVGLPFSLTNAVLQCGKAAQSNTTADQVDAGLTVTFAVIDIVTAPFIIGALVKIPAEVAAEAGIKLTAKTVFSEVGKPLLSAVGKELAKGEIAAGVKATKTVVTKIIKKLDD
ncbi:unnamed protein product [Rotaria magnacalcarata]|uniref:RanBP2-type domain-containing protein n=1 Tax=Rotaria magnacalcarata TaxID=392030 RepID=A0A815M6W5_9BILA|nr:unnamed protein product [Rotaria magnacalcarata]CAF1625384.1 unnamed protein product [Rotaria magnacalcarata]CAF2097318.1 unnamed protein product [Rotaria magnacalcarata]CAF2114344.1 unnamed protein product [Rotaria magnacalcarata]CAF3813080.1 unnamed protein product [Rotaria magnacalcarata]